VAYLTGALAARIIVADFTVRELWIPVAVLLLLPFIEWVIHVFVLHWKPRDLGRIRLDTRLARDHRRHHADPRDVDLVFIPTRSLPWALAILGVVAPLGIGALVGTPLTGTLSFMVVGGLTLLGYEWVHYLVHTDYKPRTRLYKAVWRNHRQHHFKNEHYWFSVTTSGISDRVLRTYPDPAAVETSPTAKNLHGATN
jgi:sterol desaturase/sphingolipid hydroxylase (fatty acid hydroxylase superfamily)